MFRVGKVKAAGRISGTTAMKRSVLLLLACLASPVSAFDIASMSDAERSAFRDEVRGYLLEHPEVLAEVANALQAKQEADRVNADKTLVAANADAIYQDGYSFVGGNPDGSMTLVEFIDYRCGYCKKAHGEVAELVKSDGDIRYVVKEFPILGDESVLASRFAISVLHVAGPEAYQAVNKGFYEGFRGEVTEATLASFATSLGLDAPAVMAGMNAPEVMQTINSNHKLAEKLQISGTPTFVLGETMVRGYLPLDQMKIIVSDERS
jgi:protein-disulfide isomerase